MFEIFKLAITMCLCVCGCLVGYSIYEMGHDSKKNIHMIFGILIAIAWIIFLIIAITNTELIF